MKTFVAAILLCAAIPAAALAGSPPVKAKAAPENLAEVCNAMGAEGKTTADGRGCINTRTGGAVVCSDDQCKDYFADPRYAKIKTILDKNRAKPQQRAL
jgi:hypothetical protein